MTTLKATKLRRSGGSPPKGIWGLVWFFGFRHPPFLARCFPSFSCAVRYASCRHIVSTRGCTLSSLFERFPWERCSTTWNNTINLSKRLADCEYFGAQVAGLKWPHKRSRSTPRGCQCSGVLARTRAADSRQSVCQSSARLPRGSARVPYRKAWRRRSSRHGRTTMPNSAVVPGVQGHDRGIGPQGVSFDSRAVSDIPRQGSPLCDGLDPCGRYAGDETGQGLWDKLHAKLKFGRLR